VIIAFVTNKIISIDTILPILYEIHKKNNQKVVVVVSRKSGISIIEKNTVINDTINEIGFKFLLGGRYRVAWDKRVVGSIQLLLLFIAGIFGAKFIHFDTLKSYPIRILSTFFLSRVFYSERDSSNHNFYKQKSQIKNKFRLFYTKGNYPVPLGGNMISYNKERLYYLYGKNIHDKRKVHFIESTRDREQWIKYLFEKSDYYFSKFHEGVNLRNGIIFVVLTFYGIENLNTEDTISQKKLRKNFENTVKILSYIKGNIPVFLKPSHGTDIEYVTSVLSNYSGFYITYLHPTMLLINTKFVICNYYSSIMADASNLGVATIEYTYYPSYIKEELNDRSMGSEYIDWFVYDDKEHFKEVVTNLISEEFSRKNPKIILQDKRDKKLPVELL